MAHLAFIFVCIVWGSSFILLERVTHAFGPVEIGIWRLLSGAAVLGIIYAVRRGEFRLAGRDWVNILLVALVANAAPHVVMPWVLAQGFGHSFFGTLVALIPLSTILLSIPMLGVWPTRRQVVGVLGGLACIAFMMADGMERGMSLGLLALGIFVPLTSAVSNTFIKWKLGDVPAVPLTALIVACAGLMLVPLECYRPALEGLGLTAPAEPGSWPLAMGCLLVLGVVGTGFSTAAFVWLILKKGPLFAGMTTYVVPVLALVWGQFDHEAITPGQLAAMAGTLGMVALVQFDPTQLGRVRRVAADTVLPAQTLVIAAEAATGELARPVPAWELADSSPAAPHQAA